MKILILTDSASNPRSFPESMRVELEETYPYLLRSAYPGAIFYQISFGNISTEKLLGQAIGYLNHWEPDVIVVQSGMADCRPEAYTEFQKCLIQGISWRFFSRLKRKLYDPSAIQRKQRYRVKPKSFRKTLKKFRAIFKKSKIKWLEISAGDNYENMRPGVTKRIGRYNRIIRDVYGNDLVRIRKHMIESGGFNDDGIHWTKSGHAVVFEILKNEIERR